MKRFALALALLGLAASPERVSIQVNPHVVMAGQAFWLTCHVTRDSHNRMLEYGVVNFREGSQRQLDGERAQATWKILIEHTPCDIGPAYCALLTDDGRWTQVRMNVAVAGCE